MSSAFVELSFGQKIRHKMVHDKRRLLSEFADKAGVKTLGLGIGKAIATHIKNFAKAKGIERMSLETGTNEAFRPARQLYMFLGYQSCEAFGDYVLSEDNMCMTKLI